MNFVSHFFPFFAIFFHGNFPCLKVEVEGEDVRVQVAQRVPAQVDRLCNTRKVTPLLLTIAKPTNLGLIVASASDPDPGLRMEDVDPDTGGKRTRFKTSTGT